MKAVLQRVSSASVTIDGKIVSETGKGFLILLGVRRGDGERELKALAEKCAALRVFEDENGKLNLSITEIGGEILVVSNFTLCADCRKGRRPSFTDVAGPQDAGPLYEAFCEALKGAGVKKVLTGRFGADMQVSLVNDGPVTIILDTDELLKK